MRRHVVLIGLPGAGKSTVGRMVAERLDAPFEDVDVEIERREHEAIGVIFTLRGEETFRRLEREEMARALDAPPGVIAAGGGWAAEPGNVEAARERALVVHLAADPEDAAVRIAGTAVRPLLTGNPRERLRVLADARAESYARADAEVDTTGRTPDEVAAEVVRLARSGAGW